MLKTVCSASGTCRNQLLVKTLVKFYQQKVNSN